MPWLLQNLPRLSEEFLDDNSFSAAKAIEGLLFSRLAPLLVLRMLPRNVLGANRIKSLLVRSLVTGFFLLSVDDLIAWLCVWCSVDSKI